MKLIFLQYNNYYNHILMKEETVADYGGEVYRVNNVQNFNFNDGVDTDHVINLPSTVTEPDYMLITDDYGEILSRWYVIDVIHTRASQCRVVLKRDLPADLWQSLKDAPMFVKRAMLSEQDELITAPEGWNFNQIKKSETLLKDYTNIPWIVGYIDPSRSDIDTIKATINRFSITTVDGIANYKYYDYSNLKANPKTFFYDTERELYSIIAYNTATSTEYAFEFIPNTYYGVREPRYARLDALRTAANTPTARNSYAKSCYDSYFPNMRKGLQSICLKTSAEIADFRSQDGAVIFDSTTSKYYQVRFENIPIKVHLTEQEITIEDTLFAYMESLVILANAHDPTIGISGTADDHSFEFECDAYGYRLTINEFQISQVECPISNTRNILNDQPFCMFAMPYGDIKIDNTTYHAADYSMLIARAISQAGAGSGGWLYDLQILPYNPITGLLVEGPPSYLSVSGLTIGKDYSPITIGQNTIDFIFWATRSTFRLSVPYTVDYTDVKIKSQTDFLRICSPGYDSIYEFNPYANRGLSVINIDCTYKPYTPYIHVTPEFNANGLYGLSYGSPRGLICRGDFSLPQTSDAWATYERNNVNYQKIFDRQVKSQTFNAAIGLYSEAKSSAKTIAGGVASAMSGNPMGALTAAGETSDLLLSAASTIERFKAQQDIHELQLEQIKAQSDTLINVGAITANYKYFPFVEHYSCTETETEAARNTILYTSMSVNRIGSISEFLNNRTSSFQSPFTFISGTIIRLWANGLDAHMLQKLSEELERGIYIDNQLT